MEIIIIGAGAAGLSAALELTKANFKPLILEARHRLGGRVYTLRDEKNNSSFELGAEFVHGKPPEICSTAREAGLKIVETAGASWHVASDGKLAPAEQEESQTEDTIWRKLEKRAQNSAPDISLRAFLDGLPPEQKFSGARRSIESYVAGYHAAEVEKISLRSLVKTERASDEIEGERAFRIAAGYDKLIDFLFKQSKSRGAEVLLDARVKTVSYRKNAVTIGVERGGKPQIFSARAAIVTPPLGVLQSNAVRFEPELSGKKSALNKMAMGATRRISLSFKRKWWTEILRRIDASKQTLGFLFARDEQIRVWWTNEPAEAAILTGWAGGERAAEFSNADADFVAGKAIESLCKIFGVERAFVESELIAAHTYDWQRDEFARGAYSYVCTGGIEAPRELAAPVADTLFFAGEATASDGHWGTVHGALASGARRARIAGKNLKANCLRLS
jgi:monoamine oxidase